MIEVADAVEYRTQEIVRVSNDTLLFWHCYKIHEHDTKKVGLLRSPLLSSIVCTHVPLVRCYMGCDQRSSKTSGRIEHTVVLSLLPVDEVKALGLNLAVDEGPSKSSTEDAVRTRWIVSDHAMYSQELLGLLMARGLAVASAMLLVSLGGFVRGSSSDELVRKGCLVLMALRVGDLKAREDNEHRS